MLDQLTKQSLDDSKAVDSDDILVKLIKLIQSHTTKPPTTLINHSFSNGYYLKALKYDEIMPIQRRRKEDEAAGAAHQNRPLQSRG